MLVRLSIAGIHEIPTSWLPLQTVVGARFVHDIIGQPLAKVGVLRCPSEHFNGIVNFKTTEQLLQTLALTR